MLNVKINVLIPDVAGSHFCYSEKWKSGSTRDGLVSCADKCVQNNVKYMYYHVDSCKALALEMH